MRILYLDLDALTPSHLSCYGYHRRTSPTIDAIAGEGVRFTNVYTSDAPCLPSRTAFYQGRFGIQTGVVGHGGAASEMRREGKKRGFRSAAELGSLPLRLQARGFKTSMISTFGARHAAHHYYAGFNEIHNTGQGGMESAVITQPVVEKWLADNAAKDDWYLHVNYWDIHTPYRTPLDFGEPFAAEPLPAWLTDDVLARHINKTGPHSASEPGMYTDADDPLFPRMPARIRDQRTLRQWIDGYDTAIRFTDTQIARVVDLLKAAGVYDDTAIIISADHGENQGELGLYGEHGTADRATCNIPMIVKWPGGRANVTNADLHYHLDWAPTVMELLGAAEHTPAAWDGRSYAGVFAGTHFDRRDELILGQAAHVCQRSVRFGPWLYVRTYHDGFHLFPEHQLFNLEDDFYEQHDLAADRPDVLREAVWRLMAWHDAQLRKLAENGDEAKDPMWSVIAEGGPFHAHLGTRAGRTNFMTYLDRLTTSGRADGAAALRQKYAALLTD